MTQSPVTFVTEDFYRRKISLWYTVSLNTPEMYKIISFKIDFIGQISETADQHSVATFPIFQEISKLGSMWC